MEHDVYGFSPNGPDSDAADAGDLSPSAAHGEDRSRAILEALFRPAAPGEAALWASRLVSRYGSIGATLSQSAEGVAEISGSGLAAALVLAARQMMIEVRRDQIRRRPIIASGAALKNYLCAIAGASPREELRILFLDARQHLIRDEVFATGTVDEVPILPREIMRRALELGASGLILAHNHPSGDATPSQSDIAETRRVAHAARTLGIVLHDHVIVARAEWTSMRTLGLI